MELGHGKNVVVLTRNYGFRTHAKDRKIPHFIYKHYPRLRVALSRRREAYNRQLDFVEELERSGSVVCIRPERPVEVGRMEKDVSMKRAWLLATSSARTVSDGAKHCVPTCCKTWPFMS
jgi:predicted patatin/cPLA2 family phospholipase